MRKIFLSISLCIATISFSQDYNIDSLPVADYLSPREYVIADIKVVGVQYLNPTHLSGISGLYRGQKISIPGNEISSAIKKYWKHGLFSDVQVIIAKTEGNNAFIEIRLTEQPRVNNLVISGINKSEQDDIKEKIEIKRGTQLTENILNNTKTIIHRHFVEKGFFNIETNMRQEADTSGSNRVNLYIEIKKNDRVKIEEIVFEGNEVFTTKRLRRVLKKTKQRDLNIFKGSKFIEADYKEDKIKLIDFYNESGYRDAKIIKEELYPINEKRIGLKLVIYEGSQYFIRKIDWVGNTKYPTDILNRVLGIKPRDIYNKKAIEERINTDEDAISTLYMDNGYLFFSVTPVETKVENDSVDLELRIYEGEPATINQVIIKGNTKTNEHVVRRELYTRPGELFSKTDLMRSYREIANLGHFNPENIGLTPLPNQADGTVDIEYVLEERANDQLELSGGWGGGYGFIGSVGVRFTNLSFGKMLDPKAWRPVPTGDGQTLSIRGQSSLQYHGINLSFMDPWFGGKKPNSFSVSINYSIFRRPDYNTLYTGEKVKIVGTFKTVGGSIGYGKRLKWPDDYFSVYAEATYNRYILNKYQVLPLPDGGYNMASVKGVLSRSSQDQMIYPRKGSSFSFSVQATPPYSLFSNVNFDSVSVYEKNKNIEFHKWTFSAAWYTELLKDLVLAVKSEFGALGYYNHKIGYPAFEKFDMGGSGLSGYTLAGTDVIPLRGYPDGELTPTRRYINADNTVSTYENGNIYTRYYAELRYPISLNPSATLYGLVFAEGGNVWDEWGKFNPFDIKRSAGVGIRAFLPMFGLLGFDYGYGFDPLYNQYSGQQKAGRKGEFHFIIGQQF
ncbi:MAG: outer membrane protein assembly factor BamA [Bacteroidales bacterium]|nr:outer membrane protein assembly factor BamA [Bacteroidales bacterium]